MSRETKASKAEKMEAIERLRELCPPGTVIRPVLRKVSASGMRRHIDFYAFRADPTERGGVASWYLTSLIARALGYSMAPRGSSGMVVNGCGMDMGFHVVNSLSYALHGRESVGPDAIASAGRPFEPTKDQYRAGYSLTCEWI